MKILFTLTTLVLTVSCFTACKKSNNVEPPPDKPGGDTIVITLRLRRQNLSTSRVSSRDRCRSFQRHRLQARLERLPEDQYPGGQP